MQNKGSEKSCKNHVSFDNLNPLCLDYKAPWLFFFFEEQSLRNTHMLVSKEILIPAPLG